MYFSPNISYTSPPPAQHCLAHSSRGEEKGAGEEGTEGVELMGEESAGARARDGQGGSRERVDMLNIVQRGWVGVEQRASDRPI